MLELSGAWCLVLGAWSLVLELGAWCLCLVLGALCFASAYVAVLSRKHRQDQGERKAVEATGIIGPLGSLK